MGELASAKAPGIPHSVLRLVTVQRKPILGIEPVQGSDPDTLTFAVELDIAQTTAKRMADRRRDRFFKGRRITVAEVDG